MSSNCRLWNRVFSLSMVAASLFAVAKEAPAQGRARRQNPPAAAENFANQRINLIQQENPNAQIRVTGGERTPRRQAELMYDRASQNRNDFLRTYRPAPHIQQMAEFVQRPGPPDRNEGVAQFEQYIEQARQNGQRVSNHLPSADGNIRSVDISVPQGDAAAQARIEQQIRQQGGTVIREENAPTGRHWHIDYDRNAGEQQRVLYDDNAPRQAPAVQITPRQSGQAAATAAARW